MHPVIQGLLGLFLTGIGGIIFFNAVILITAIKAEEPKYSATTVFAMDDIKEGDLLQLVMCGNDVCFVKKPKFDFAHKAE
jgi:hypothetical protein